MSNANVWEVWLLNHEPKDLEECSEIGVKDQALDALLSLSLKTLTVKDVVNLYNISEERAMRVCLIANKMVSDIEEFLLSSMGYNSS
jgi:hypothetical protein